MLYVYHGADTAEAGDKARALVESLRAKRPDATYVYMQADDWDASSVEGHLGGQGLFSSKYIIFLDRVTENSEAKEALPDLLASFHESPNIFVVLEGKVTADLKKALTKSADKMVEVEKKVAKEASLSSEPNVFALASALGSGDAFKAWKIYREAVDGGAALEAILGMLFWKAKSVNDKKLARDIVVLYHDGHRGLNDLELATERLVLNCGKR